MTKNTRITVHAALLAALYVILTQLQNMLLPGSATALFQCRLSEALSVAAFFTPAAVPGLSVGCLLFNLIAGSGLAMDALVGPLATLLAAWCMRRLRRFPVPAMLAPALFNGLLVGWELSLHTGSPFLVCAGYVAAGEALALLTLGSVLYALLGRGLGNRLFGKEN